MVTDRLPSRNPLRAEFFASDRLTTLDAPADDRLRVPACSIERAMESGEAPAVRRACVEFVAAAADFYQVRRPLLRVLAARPIRIREGGWASELFGDYHPESTLLRVWMRTAIRKQVTSFGTFFSTLCHEFCHHVDYARLGFHDSPHTRGFYQRAAVLYHHARGTTPKQLFWIAMPGGRWRIDWPRTTRSVERL